LASKEETLERIRKALGKPVSAAVTRSFSKTSSARHKPATHSPSPVYDAQLLARFCEEVEKLGAKAVCVESHDEILEYLKNFIETGSAGSVAVSDGAMIRDSAIREWLASQGIAIVPTLREFATTIEDSNSGLSAGAPSLMDRYKAVLIDARLGITSADCAIAETGTLVLVSGGEQHRLISLVPPVHVCLLDAGKLVSNLAELLARASEEYYSKDVPPQAMTFITGTSRTADIELTLTRGVHGPREVHILVYADRAREESAS
jgi:L-lactate dehydrogenase complex protein LldG